MRIFCDSNILLRLAEPKHPMHADAYDSCLLLRRAGHELCVVPQNFHEFWVVATKKTTENGLGMDVPEADAELGRLRGLFTLVPDSPLAFDEWLRLVLQYNVKGKPGHDAKLVALMHVHAVTHLLTFNDADFKRYPTITVLTPAGVLAGSHP